MKINIKHNPICIFIMLWIITMLSAGCRQNSNQNNVAVTSSISNNNFSITNQVSAVQVHYKSMVKYAKISNSIPRSVEYDSIRWINDGFDWTEGFFPGSLWYLYELTQDNKWKNEAEYFQKLNFEDRFASSHDLGFVFQCSYGNALRLTKNDNNKPALIDAADALIARFNPKVGCIKSWDVSGGWQKERGWQYPVIIDNMMNLELLFETSLITGNKKYKEIAIIHANTTLANHFRDDNSSFHVVDFDSITGEVRMKHTAQGFAHESSWARGQAWGLYGYTLCYRYTKDKKYLEQAVKIAEYMLSNPAIKNENIPFWDYKAPNIPNEPRDASAAAITASALIELSKYSDLKYLEKAKDIIKTLSSPEYFAKPGTNHNFLLKHCVGSIPHNSEIDVPLIYADYYYLESLVRLSKL